MENTENNDKNESNNNNELRAILDEILPLVQKIQDSDVVYEKLAKAKTYWDRNEEKLFNINTLLEIKYSEILEKIKCAEETTSQLPGVIDSITSQVESQYAENIQNMNEQWDETAKKIEDYARKFPQAFVVYSNENLNAQIEKNREETARVREEIKELKLQEENLNLQAPHTSLIADLSKHLDDIKSINREVKRNLESSTENIKMLVGKKGQLQQSIEELKKKFDEKDRRDLA